MACHLVIDKHGRVKDWRFTRALVRIAEVIAYEDAQARIDSGEAGDNLKNLWAAWKALFKARAARDPLELELPERRVVLDEHGKIAEIALRERLDAHRVVEDFMIAANVAAAKALESKASPVVYRVHEPPTREKLMALKEYFKSIGRNLALGQVITPSLFNRMIKDVSDEAEKALVMEAVLRSQTQAYYGPKNAGHFGLSLGSYAHFTSPIRRYVAAWLAGRIGETFRTRITGVQSFGFFATIVGLGGDGLVPVSSLGREYFRYDEGARALVGEKTGERFGLGDTLKLRLGEANPLTGALKFEPVEGSGQRIEKRGDRVAPKERSRPKHAQGPRGRPGNIRHQGRGRGKR